MQQCFIELRGSAEVGGFSLLAYQAINWSIVWDARKRVTPPYGVPTSSGGPAMYMQISVGKCMIVIGGEYNPESPVESEVCVRSNNRTTQIFIYNTQVQFFLPPQTPSSVTEKPPLWGIHLIFI